MKVGLHAGEARARKIVRERSMGRCEICRINPATSWGHRLPRGQGGLWRPSNGLDLCGDGVAGCHGWTEKHRSIAYAEGWLLKREAGDPTTEIVWIQSGANPPGYYLLDDDGCMVWLDWVELGRPVRPPADRLPPWATPSRH